MLDQAGIYNLFPLSTGMRVVLDEEGNRISSKESYQLSNYAAICIHGCPDCLSLGIKSKSGQFSEKYSISKYILDLLFRYNTAEIRLEENTSDIQIKETLEKHNMIILSKKIDEKNKNYEDLENKIDGLIGQKFENKLLKLAGNWVDCPISNSPHIELSYLLCLI